MKKILIFSLMLASFLCSEAKERSLQQKLEIASEVLGERLPSVGGKTSRGGVGESLRVMRQTDAYTVVGRNRNGFVVLANDDAFKAVIGYSDEGTFGDNPAWAGSWLELMTLHFVLLLRVIRLSLQVVSRVLSILLP